MIEYKADGKIAVVTGVTGKEADLKIPEEIDGLIVGKIAEDAISENNNIKKLTIPKTVKVISSYAFSSCHKLTELVITDGVEVIEDWAFAACPIQKIILPPSVRIIGANAFLGSDCKPKVDDFLRMKNRPKQKRSFMNNSCFIPISAYQDLESINPEYMRNQSDYVDSQFDSLERGYTDYMSLDVPFIFNQDQFMIAFFSDKKLDYFSVDLNNDTKKQIGLYKEDDPTYLAARIDVFSHQKKVATIDSKIPYIEKAIFTLENTQEVVIDEKYCYFLTVTADFESYGNGNIDFEFSFNAFDDISGKYQTQFEKGLITEDVHNRIEETLKRLRIETMVKFYRGLKGAPYVAFLDKLYNSMIDSNEFDNETLIAYHDDQLENYYYTLTNAKSLADMCFGMDDHVKFFETITGKSLQELCDKFNVYLVSEEGIELSEADLNYQYNNFADIKENYFLHAEMLEELFVKLRDLNREFSMYAYKN